MRVISTYGIHHTSSESALIVYLGDVYWWKKHQDHRAMPLITIRRHYGAFHTHAKIWQSGFFWLTMYEDTKNFVSRCGACQWHGNFNSRDAIPLTNNLHIELFDV
jgi:hypothetical protein